MDLGNNVLKKNLIDYIFKKAVFSIKNIMYEVKKTI
jgi:hypothetical protein